MGRWGSWVVVAMLLACGGGQNGGRDSESGGIAEAGDESGSGGSSGGETGDGSTGPGGETPTFVSIRIEPADVLIEVVEGVVPAPIDFTAIGTTDDGEEIEISTGTWAYDEPGLATVNQGTGELTATGLAGGLGTLTFDADGVQGTTTAAVKLEYVSNPNNVDPMVFDGATVADPAMAIAYPYDQTVFPLGLTGPLLQWNGTNAGDLYKLHFESPYFELTAYTAADPPSRWALPELPVDMWLALTEASAAEDVAVQIQRRDATTTYLPVSQTWHIADANLTGIIYYWEVNNGNVVRLQIGADAPEAFLAPPPAYDDNGDGVPTNQCIACHSVSSDGSTIVASAYGGASPWGTWNADGTSIFFSGNEVPPIYPGDASGFQAISPDGAFVISGQSQGPDLNATPGAAGGTLKLTTNDSTTALATLSIATGSVVHPAWSHDGSKIAFGVRTDGNWLDFNTSSLWVADVDTVTPGFANPQLLVAPSPTERATVTFPTFSPDSQWIAFNKSNQARTRGGSGELWLIGATGVGEVELARANGAGVLDDTQQNINFEPTFMPVSVGGYNWLVFVSERVYGNTLTDQAPGTRFKQLWVAAIDAAPGAGDPSHPAFWLPGQELDNQNMRGNWALAPCKDLGASCEAGFECCTGYCGEDGTCTDDVPSCSPDGSACVSDSDCCNPASVCINGYCGEITPG